MPRAVSVFSSEPITPESLAPLMRRLQATPDDKGWIIERSNRQIYVEINTQDLPQLTPDTVTGAAELLGSPVKSSVVFVYNDAQTNSVEYRIAQATIRAMAETWPIVYDDHASSRKRIWPKSASN